MQKTTFNMEARLSEYSEELSKTLGFTPVVLGIQITETVNSKSELCEKMIKGASVVLPVMPDPDFVEYERKTLDPKFIDPAYYGLIGNEFLYHSENHEEEISGVIVFVNRPGFQEEFSKHTETLARKIIAGQPLTMEDETLIGFYQKMTDYNGNPINYRFEYIKDLEIIVPEGEGVEEYLCAGEICENCGGIKETCP